MSSCCSGIRERDRVIENLTAENEQLRKENAHLQALLNKHNHALFGRSSEKMPVCTKELQPAEKDIVQASEPMEKRGARFGHKGHGRQLPDLNEVAVIHEIPEQQQYCPICGKPRRLTNLDEVSYEIDYEIRYYRKKHIRKKAFSTCHCAGPRSVVAPKPSQVIPKGKYSNAFLAHILVMKFFFQIPLHRQILIMFMQGLTVGAGALTGMLKKLEPLLYPLYLRLVEVNRSEGHWHIDETGWMNYVQIGEKEGWHWWLWVFAAPKTVVFVLDPSRSSAVPFKQLGRDAQGIVVTDRFSAYAKLLKLITGLKQALCWAHFRRDFINAGKAVKSLRAWADLWVARIADIYRINRERLSVLDNPNLFAAAQLRLKDGLESMRRQMSVELEDAGLFREKRKVLNSAVKHWEGLTVFSDNPLVPMDNNFAERLLRPAALARKNYYGTHALWSGNLLACAMSVLQTAARYKLNGEAYLRYYLDGCAQHHGTPPNLDQYLPWNIPDEIIQKYNMKPGRAQYDNTG